MQHPVTRESISIFTYLHLSEGWPAAVQEPTNGDLLNILSEGRDGHPALCPAAWELIKQVRGDDHDAQEGLVTLAGNGRLVAQAALEELGVRYIPETVLQKARESVEQRRGWLKAMVPNVDRQVTPTSMRKLMPKVVIKKKPYKPV